MSIEQQYKGIICGVDEAGRGPLAGPVVAAAVILPAEFNLPKLNDSKLISANIRNALNQDILRHSIWNIAESSVEEIEKLNILNASLLAMKRAVEGLSESPAMALIDGNKSPPNLSCPAQTVIKGDQLSSSIAAASIVAKVHRDTIMKDLAKDYPGYGWETNMGYSTKAHQEAFLRLGPTPHHRKSFIAKLEEKRIVA